VEDCTEEDCSSTPYFTPLVQRWGVGPKIKILHKFRIINVAQGRIPWAFYYLISNMHGHVLKFAHGFRSCEYTQVKILEDASSLIFPHAVDANV